MLFHRRNSALDRITQFHNLYVQKQIDHKMYIKMSSNNGDIDDNDNGGGRVGGGGWHIRTGCHSDVRISWGKHA